MYGFSISKRGILTDNYFKQLGYYELPESQGVFIMIRKIGFEIKINQDFHGNYGLYIYKNINKNFFSFSNSFLLLVEYLLDKQKISLNKDFTDNFVISDLCTPSVYETMIKEITKIPSNEAIIINIKRKTYKIDYINYQENTILLESKKGLKTINRWVDKWGYILRSLIRKSNNISSNLSGGFDTRMVLAILLSSGININDILINTSNDKNHCHEEDMKIAKNIATKFGFKLNNKKLDNNGMEWSIEDILSCTLYSKLGFHKEFYFKKEFFYNPRFALTGGSGEEIRGYPGITINEYIDKISSRGKYFGKQFYLASTRLLNRSRTFLKNQKVYIMNIK